MSLSENSTATGVPQRPWGRRLLCGVAELLVVAAAAIAAVSAAWPVLHFHENALPPDIASYFGMFNVSAMIGTGHGIVRGSEEKLPELKAFLHGKSPRLNLPKAEASAMSQC